MSRTPRAEAIQGERRRRKADTLDRIHGRKLTIPPQYRDDPEHDYYWANDEDSRIYDLTVEDDYDHVTLAKPEASEEEKVRRPVGTKATGEPMYAYLLRKPKEFVEEDRAKRLAAIDEREQGIMRSAKTDPNDDRSDDVAYVVKGNSIKHGAYTP